MRDHIGGMDAYYIGDGLWRTGFTTGAWREGRGGEESFKRYRLYVGIGAPYVFNLGFKYRVSKSWFVEVESLIIPRFPFLAFSFGTSTTEYANPPSFIFFDLEAEVVIGYRLTLASEFINWGLPPSKIGGGLVGEVDLETVSGFVIYLKIGIVDYYLFSRNYIGHYGQLGFGWNF
jgi:hypothetical protein